MTAKGPVITERDAEIALTIYKYRYLSVSQLQRLHFPSLQTTYRRLRALTQLGLVQGFTAPGISEHLYYLSDAGATLVATTLGVTLSDLRFHRTTRAPKDYYFLQHFLRVNDFRIALTQACDATGLSLLGFVPEYFGEKTVEGGIKKHIKDVACDVADPARKISHTPDGVFALAKNQSAALFFLELDRGTEGISDEEKGVLKMIKFYLNYLLTSQYQRYQEDFNCGPFRGFRALIVTTSAARIEHIRQVITTFPFDERAKKFIWLTEQSQTTTIFQPIWRSADVTDSTLYRIG